MTKLVIYTDGACSRNPGPGGWTVVIPLVKKSQAVVIKGGDYTTTNNRMELKAIIEGLKFAQMAEATEVVVYTDSKYCCDMVNQCWMNKWLVNGWRKSDNRPVENLDLVQEFYDLTQVFDEFTISHVRGHQNNQFNNACDRIAVSVYRDREFDQSIDTVELSSLGISQ